MNNHSLNGNNTLKTLIFSIISRIFNITPSQLSRVGECWTIIFFFKIGSAIGWTIITAAFVAHFGIYFLPVLLIFNAIFIILSTLFFEKLIMVMKREVLMILMILLAAVCIFFATFIYGRFPIAFFTLVIIAESIFLAQFNIFIPILVGDRFSPIESQSTFPVVESADTIGGIIGGTLVGIFASHFHITWFLYIWIGFLACVIFVFVITNYLKQIVPALPVKISSSRISARDQVKQVFKSINRIPFLKSLMIIVLFQWVFMNVLDFQYTKSIEQAVTKKQESTIAYIDSSMLKTDVLGSAVNNAAKNEPRKSVLSNAEEAMLAEKLGTFKGIFYGVALIVQVLLASRVITSLGIVGSMLLHPVIMLISLIGMFLKFGFLSSFVSKINYEASNVVYKNAYFASHYAFPKFIRDPAAEFLEGIVRPAGTILGMILILGLQIFFSGKDLSMFIHIIMFLVMSVVLISTIKLQPQYTAVTRSQLFSNNLPYPEKINAIEILMQHGHDDNRLILGQKLHDSLNEHPAVRIKLLSSLGELKSYEVLPEILDALRDDNIDIRFEAAHALLNFNDIGEKFYSQAFSRFRTIEILKEIFKNETSAAVRSTIIRVFSLIKQQDVVPFLLDILKTEDQQLKADCVYTLGLFHDPSAAYYVVPFLEDQNPMVRANAAIALWQFPKYKNVLEDTVGRMLDEKSDLSVLQAALYAVGEIGISKKRILWDLLNSDNSDMRLEAAFALTKLGDAKGCEDLVNYILDLPDDKFEFLSRFLYRLKPQARKVAEKVLIQITSEYLNMLMYKYAGKSLGEIDRAVLEKLRRLYKMLDQHEELFEIETVLQKV